MPSLPSSPNKDESLTMVVPFTQPPDDSNSHSLPPGSRFGQVLSPASIQSEEDTDGFTLVLPTLAKADSPSRHPTSRPSSSGTPTKSHLPVRSPGKHGTENRPLLGHASSPIFNRKLASPGKVSHSPQRHVGDVFGDHSDGVQVYEDPFESEHGLVQGRTPGKPVLEEIPVNERNSDVDANNTSPSKEDGVTPRRPGHLKTTSTGSELDTSGQPVSGDVLRTRRLLASAIDRVRAKTLDAHGFRKIQELVKLSSSANSAEAWGDATPGSKSLYGELLLSLLEYLESPAEDLRVPGTANSGSAKVVNLKTQVLATVRAMLALPRKEVSSYTSRALCAVIRSRKGVDEMSYLAADMERLAEESAKTANASEALDSVLDLVDEETKSLFPGSPALPQVDLDESKRREPLLASPAVLTMALAVLGNLLTAMAAQHIDVSPLQTKRLGGIAVRLLQDPNSEVRRADLEFCLELHKRLGGENGEGFWKAVQGWGVRESGVNLIMYYLAKRGKATHLT
jgi:CLIP-associating protein 1/2